MINMNFSRSTPRILSAFLGTLIFLTVATAANAQVRVPFVSGSCYNSDPTDPASVAACISTDAFHEFQDDCQDAFYWYIRATYFDRQDQGVDVGNFRDFIAQDNLFPSCRVLSEARAVFSGEPFPWAPCIPDGSEGTVEHMTACLRATNSFPRTAECRAVYDAYDEQVMKAIPALYQPQIPRLTLAPGEERVFEGRSQQFRVIQTGAMNSHYVLRLDTRPRDCTVAAQVVENFLPSGPNWLACTGYSASAVPEHFAACVARNGNLSELSRLSCPDQRARYEELLTSANLRLPESYRPITCPQIEEGLVLAQQSLAEERAAAAAQPARTAPEPSSERRNGRVASWFTIVFALIINLALIVGAVGFAVIASLRDVRKIPYKRQMWRVLGMSAGVWVLVALIAPAITEALSGPSPEGGMFWAFLIFYAVLGSIGFFGVRLFFIGRHKLTQREDKVTEDGFIEAEDDGHILYEDSNTTALYFFMWSPGGAYPTHGRIIEIRPDKFTVSPIQKVKKPAWRTPQFKEWYDSGEWAKGAKTYDPKKIDAIRLVSESRIEDPNVPPFHVLVMDYGNKHVELNIQEREGVFKPWVGHVSRDQEAYVRLTKLIAETLRKRRDGSQAGYDDFEVNVTFDGVSDEEAKKMRQEVEDMVNKLDGNDGKPKKPPPTHEDPF